MTEPLIGSEAVRAGRLTRHTLRTRFVAVYPDVYVAAGAELTAVSRAKAAWLWTGRQGIVAGRSAAALHGAKWVKSEVAVLDMGWRDAKIAVDYDGEHHRRTRREFNKGIRRHEAVTELGWKDIRVTAEDTDGGILACVEQAWAQRACAPGGNLAESPLLTHARRNGLDVRKVG